MSEMKSYFGVENAIGLVLELRSPLWFGKFEGLARACERGKMYWEDAGDDALAYIAGGAGIPG